MLIAALETTLAISRAMNREWIWATANIALAAFFGWLVIELAVKEVTACTPQENPNE